MLKQAASLCIAGLILIGCAGGKKVSVSMSQEEASRSLSQLQKRVQEHPDDLKARLELAKAQAALGKIDTALVVVNDVLRDDPHYYVAYLLRAQLLEKKGETLEQYKTLLALFQQPDTDKYVQQVAEELGSPYPIRLFELGPGNHLMLRFSPDGSKIVWQSDRKGNWDIFLAQADGRLTQALTMSPADDEMPTFVAQGKAVVFTSSRDDLTPRARGEKNRELYFLDLGGRSPVRLTENMADDWFPVATNDSLSFVYVSEEGDNRPVKFFEKHSNLFKFSFADTSYQALTQDAWDNTSPVVLPDGRLAWVRIREAEYEIVVGHPGAEVKSLLKGPEPKSGLAVSPDGKRLAFFMKKDGNIDIYELNLESRQMRRLTADLATDFYPTYAPDGKRLLFSSNRNGLYQIFELAFDQVKSRAQLVELLEHLIQEVENKQTTE